MSGPGRDDWSVVGGRRPVGGGRRPRDDVDGAGSGLVRPYAVTGGRTRPRYQLQIEALGAARAPVADMAVEGQVRVHQMDHAHGRPDLNLLERVLSGLRKL
jgi:hypothetical protein